MWPLSAVGVWGGGMACIWPHGGAANQLVRHPKFVCSEFRTVPVQGLTQFVDRFTAARTAQVFNNAVICIWKQRFAVSWEAGLFCKIRWGSSLLVRCQVCLLTFSKSDWKMGYCITKCDDVWCFDTCTRYVCFCFWMYPVCNTLSNQKSNRWACRPGIWPKDKILSRSAELATQLTVLYRY